MTCLISLGDSPGVLIDPGRTIAVAIRSGNPNASRLFLISQVSLIQTSSPNLNNLANLSSEIGNLRYSNPSASFAITCGSLDQEQESNIKYSLITRNGWSPCPEVLVNTGQGKAEIPEGVPRKRCKAPKKWQPLLQYKIHHANVTTLSFLIHFVLLFLYFPQTLLSHSFEVIVPSECLLPKHNFIDYMLCMARLLLIIPSRFLSWTLSLFCVCTALILFLNWHCLICVQHHSTI